MKRKSGWAVRCRAYSYHDPHSYQLKIRQQRAGFFQLPIRPVRLLA